MSSPKGVCTCDEIDELFEWRTDPWGRRWRLSVEDTGHGYFIVDGNGMTYLEEYCPIHGPRGPEPYWL